MKTAKKSPSQIQRENFLTFIVSALFLAQTPSDKIEDEDCQSMVNEVKNNILPIIKENPHFRDLISRGVESNMIQTGEELPLTAYGKAFATSKFAAPLTKQRFDNVNFEHLMSGSSGYRSIGWFNQLFQHGYKAFANTLKKELEKDNPVKAELINNLEDLWDNTVIPQTGLVEEEV
jgi:hypothetical protein